MSSLSTDDKKVFPQREWKLKESFIKDFKPFFTRHLEKKDDLTIVNSNKVIFLDVEGSLNIHQIACRSTDVDWSLETKGSNNTTALNPDNFFDKVNRYFQSNYLLVFTHFAQSDLQRLVGGARSSGANLKSIKDYKFACSIEIIKCIFDAPRSSTRGTYPLATLYEAMLQEEPEEKEVHTALYDSFMLQQMMRFIISMLGYHMKTMKPVSIKEFSELSKGRFIIDKTVLEAFIEFCKERLWTPLPNIKEELKSGSIHRAFIDGWPKVYRVSSKSSDAKVHYDDCSFITQKRYTIQPYSNYEEQFDGRTWCSVCSFIDKIDPNKLPDPKLSVYLNRTNITFKEVRDALSQLE